MELVTYLALLLLVGLVAFLAVRVSSRRGDAQLGRAMRLASGIVSEGLASSQDQKALDRMLEELATLLDASACVIAVPTGDGRLRCGASFGYPDPETQFIKINEGMCGRVYETGSPLVAPDVADEPSFVPVIPGVTSAACLPLTVRDAVIGALNVESSSRRYTEADLELLEPLADQIAALLDNRRLRQATEVKQAAELKARLELEAVSSVVLAGIASTGDLDEALESMVGSIADDMGWESMAVILREGDGDVLNTRAYYGYTAEVAQVGFPLGKGIVGSVAATGKARLVGDTRLDPDYWDVVEGTRSEMCVPLRSGDRILGVLNAESPRVDAFTPEDLRLLQMLADQMSVVIERARLNDVERETLQRLMELDKLKDDFLATVSHELRTPLTSIKGSAETMLARVGQVGPEEQRGLLEAMVRQSDRLSKMVETLLLVSRLESGEIGDQPSYVLLKDALSESADAAGDPDRVHLEMEGASGLITDRFRLHHIVRNLIENACKYSPGGAPVLVRASGDELSLTIDVFDQGPGLPEGMEEAAFARFRRLEDSDWTVPGTGLGLYIARRFARDIGGDVEVRRGTEPPWTGAHFSVTLPSLGALPEPNVQRTAPS